MIVGTVIVELYAPWVHSLKEKRRIVKSLIAKTQNKFHVSIAEIEEQDTHQIIVLGAACVTDSEVLAGRMMDQVIDFIQANTEADITAIQREMR